jgi:hypothetical protein
MYSLTHFVRPLTSEWSNWLRLAPICSLCIATTTLKCRMKSDGLVAPEAVAPGTPLFGGTLQLPSSSVVAAFARNAPYDHRHGIKSPQCCLPARSRRLKRLRRDAQVINAAKKKASERRKEQMMLTRRNAALALSEAPLFKTYMQLRSAKGSMQQCVGTLQRSCVTLCERVQKVADSVLVRLSLNSRMDNAPHLAARLNNSIMALRM